MGCNPILEQLLLSMRTESLVSSQIGRSVDVDAPCKRARTYIGVNDSSCNVYVHNMSILQS